MIPIHFDKELLGYTHYFNEKHSIMDKDKSYSYTTNDNKYTITSCDDCVYMPTSIKHSQELHIELYKLSPLFEDKFKTGILYDIDWNIKFNEKSLTIGTFHINNVLFKEFTPATLCGEDLFFIHRYNMRDKERPLFYFNLLF